MVAVRNSPSFDCRSLNPGLLASRAWLKQDCMYGPPCACFRTLTSSSSPSSPSASASPRAAESDRPNHVAKSVDKMTRRKGTWRMIRPPNDTLRPATIVQIHGFTISAIIRFQNMVEAEIQTAGSHPGSRSGRSSVAFAKEIAEQQSQVPAFPSPGSLFLGLF